MPEEGEEEEPKLRLRVSQQIGEPSPVRVEKIDLQKYIIGNSQFPHRNTNQVFQHSSCMNAAESSMFSQIENHDLGRFDDKNKKAGQELLS